MGTLRQHRFHVREVIVFQLMPLFASRRCAEVNAKGVIPDMNVDAVRKRRSGSGEGKNRAPRNMKALWAPLRYLFCFNRAADIALQSRHSGSDYNFDTGVLAGGHLFLSTQRLSVSQQGTPRRFA